MSRLNSRIVKLTGLFGGMQTIGILCSVVRAKLVAVWIGGAGLGLFALFNSALELIYALSQLGIRQSAVRDMAAASDSQIPRIVWTIRRWSLALGFAGAMLTLLFSRWLSVFSFGDTSWWWAFACLSLIVFLSAVNQGEGAIFQGLRRFRKLAVCSMLGAVGGLAVSVPMFYFWRIDSIVPSILAYGIVTWIAMGYYREAVPHPDGGMPLSESIMLGKQFMLLGVYLTVSSVVANAVSYGFMSYLNNFDGTDTTGYYSAGFTLVNRYVGIVFTALSMEYFPRLSGVVRSAWRTGVFVSNQIYLSLAVLVPVVIVFIAFSPSIVRILYDGDFLVMLPFTIWAMAGTVLRAVSWCMSFVILARGDGRIYLATEVISGIVSLTLNIIGFNLWGFAGLGYAYVGWYALYTLLIGFVYYRRYALRSDRELPFFVGYSMLMAVGASLTATIWSCIAVVPLAVVASVVSARLLRRKLRKVQGA